MATIKQKRILILIFCFLAIFITSWLDLFMQRQQHLIGAGINRAFLFLLINAHVIVIAFLLYVIVRQSLKLFLESRRGMPGSIFKRNLLFAFTLFSVIPSFFVFFTAGKFIATSIDDWFHARIGCGLQNGLELHKKQTKDIRTRLNAVGEKAFNLVNQNIEQAQLMIAKLNKENPELAQYTLHIWRQDGVNTVRPSVPADAAGAKAMAPMALRKGRELVEGTIERTNLYDSIKDEVKIWRKYRKINDRSTHSLKKAFFNIIKNPDFENPFDFYGSLYWVKRSKNLIFVLVQRYPEEIRGPLIEVQNSISDYQQLKSMHNPIFLSYIFTFILVTLIILFLSIWCAFYFARGLVQPIHELISAMSKIRSGNLNSRITNHPSNDLRHLTIGLNDMTSALQQAQQKLDAQNQEMLKINTLKTWQEAAKQMAHEIKNPLTPIQLATQRMQRKYSQVLGNDPIFESSTNTILTQVKIIQDLVSHFYKFATLPQLNTQPTQINDLIKDSVSLYQISYPEIIFELSLDNSNTVLNLDQNKIKRVFTNLLDNSIRAMQKLADGRQKVVAISTKMADNKLEIIFSDTGPGIPKTMKTKLFLPYVSTEKKNMGLGLAIVHEIILQHGGTIQLESSECGAKFKIELPAN